MVERLVRIQKVRGSIPLISIISKNALSLKKSAIMRFLVALIFLHRKNQFSGNCPAVFISNQQIY